PADTTGRGRRGQSARQGRGAFGCGRPQRGRRRYGLLGCRRRRRAETTVGLRGRVGGIARPEQGGKNHCGKKWTEQTHWQSRQARNAPRRPLRGSNPSDAPLTPPTKKRWCV